MELTNINISSLKKQYLYELVDIYPQREIENIYLELILEIKKWNKIDFLLHENIYLIEAEVLFLKDALEKLKAGATLIQIYTGFIYEGPRLVKRINRAILKEC